MEGRGRQEGRGREERRRREKGQVAGRRTARDSPQRNPDVTMPRTSSNSPMREFEFDSVYLQNLIVRVRTGDRAAEDMLIRAILGRFQNLARRMLNRFPDLKCLHQTGDIVQDALLRLLRAIRAVTPQ